MRRSVIAVLALLASACAPFVPVVDLTKVPPADRNEALKIRVFTIESAGSYPEIAQVLGEVRAYSCKSLPTDPPASKGEALTRLRLEALKLHADAITDVTFDTRGTNAWGTNCWESVQASGQAVRLK
jgi:uncharacterized protein YbjQ (UPF0145 family)